MSILDFFGPKIAEPKSFDKDLFIKYYVEYHLDVIGEKCENGSRNAEQFFAKAKTDNGDSFTFDFDNRLVKDYYWTDSDFKIRSRQLFKDWLKPGKAHYVYFTDSACIDIDSDGPYATYLVRPLLYARLYPNKAISKQILSVLHAIQTISAKELKPIYEGIKQRFEEKQAKEAEEKRQAAMNILLGNTKQR